ncbi:MAG: DUF2961 domain-containing protein [Fidelibacterota bacterium]
MKIFSNCGDTVRWKGKWTVYRHHLPDPIHFRKSIKITVEHGHANNRCDDWACTAYWYQKKPHKPFKEPVLKELIS